MTPIRRRLVGLVLLAAACASGAPPAAALDEANERCTFCRMAVSSQRFAAQLVAPREEPRFFDDLGCLRSYLEGQPSIPAGTVTYVADHRTRTWVRAEQAVYTRQASIATPMGSHVIAHESAASRDADPEAKGGSPLGLADVFPQGRIPGASR